MAKILIVDDEKDMADLLGASLELEGHQCEGTLNGEEAIEAANKIQFDLALIDIRLPGINGVEVFLRLKKANPKIRVIMITGFSVEDLIKEALKEGAYACLHKPFDMERVTELIKEALSENKRLILVVDDEAAIREQLSGILKEKGYRTCLAENGEEAIARLKIKHYDCILLDLRLPDVDGLEILREAKKIDPEVVVIVITGYDLPQMLKEAKSLSAYACMKKPIDLDRLLALLKEALD